MRPTIALVAGFALVLCPMPGSGVATGADKPVFDGWKYPGAKELTSGSGAGGHHATLAADDGLEKVLAFYEKKTGEKLKPDAPGGGGISGGAGKAQVFQDDSIRPGRKGARPVTLRVLVQRTKEYDLTLVISRARDEDHTHIALTYFPK